MGSCTGISNLRTSCLGTKRKMHRWKPLILDCRSSLNLVNCFLQWLFDDAIFYLQCLTCEFTYNYQISIWIEMEFAKCISCSVFVYTVMTFLCFTRRTLHWNCWQSLLHGTRGSKEKLWPRNWCMECWSYTIHPSLWCSPILGRWVSSDTHWQILLLNSVNTSLYETCLFI